MLDRRFAAGRKFGYLATQYGLCYVINCIANVSDGD
jgi:hypothetical protein